MVLISTMSQCLIQCRVCGQFYNNKVFICLFQIENCPIFKYLSSLQIFLRVANLFPESSRGVGARQQSPVPAKHHTGEAPSGRRDNSDQVRS